MAVYVPEITNTLTEANGVASAVNSTTALLSGGATYTGTWVEMALYSTVSVSIIASVATTGTIWFDVSHDGGSTFASIPRDVKDTTFDVPHLFLVAETYLRIRYVNDSVAQTGTWSLQTMLYSKRPMDLSTVPRDEIRFSSESKLTRQANDFNQDRNQGNVEFSSSKREIGVNESVSTAFETIWAGADLGGVLNYVFPTTAETVRVKAGGNAADTAAGLGARTIIVEGLDENWEEASETITLAGASQSAATTTTFYRINNVYTDTVGTYAGVNTGDIIIENTTAGEELAYIGAGIGNALQCVYTVPAGMTLYITGIKLSVGQGNSADVRLFHIENVDDFSAPFTSVKHFEWGVEDYSGADTFPFVTNLKFDEKNDVIADAKRITGGGSARVSLDFEFILETN